MSTSRRRPTGSSRRPQVAGRPRTTSGGPADAEQTTEGGLAVDERTDARGGGRAPSSGDAVDTPSGSPRSRSVTRPATPPSDDGRSPAAEPAEAPASDGATETAETTETAESTEAAGTADDTSEGDLRAAPAVRSGEADEKPEPRGAALAARLRRIPLPQAPATRRATAALLAVTILLVAAAAFFAVSWGRLQFSGATSNTALTDVGATATVSEQVNDAVTKVYSFDFARLDQAESDARAVITGPFTGQFDQIFGNVRQLAPKQQAVVTATIPKSAVSSIEGDHATLYVFVNQVIRRVDDGGKPQEGTAAARLRVDADYLDGRWKISGMTPA